MKVQEDIENMKKIHSHILNLLDQENDQEEVFQNIMKLKIKKYQKIPIYLKHFFI